MGARVSVGSAKMISVAYAWSFMPPSSWARKKNSGGKKFWRLLKKNIFFKIFRNFGSNSNKFKFFKKC
jgi:hypothetical protein